MVHNHVHNSSPLFLILSQMNPVRTLIPFLCVCKIHFSAVSHPCLGLQVGSWSSDFPTKTSHAPTRLILPDLIILIKFGGEYKLWNASLYSFHRLSVIFCLLLAYFPYLKKDQSRLMRSPWCLCVSPYEAVNTWINIYEIWYVYHGTWAHLTGVLQKALPSVWVYVTPPVVARQWLGKNVTASTNTQQ
jgi:hypothetical protein